MFSGKSSKRSDRLQVDWTMLKSTTNGKDELRLKEQLQQFADEYWLPDPVSAERGAEIILEAFKRKIAGKLELLDVVVDE